MNLAPFFIAAITATALAQDTKPNPRYEIMWRTRELDRAWLAHTSSQERSEALRFLPRARPYALEGDSIGAAQALDLAQSKLGRSWSDAGCLAVTPSHRLLDSEDTLSITVSQLYGQSSLFPWYLSFDSALTKGSIGPSEIDFSLGMLGWQTKIDALHDGDYKFVLGITDGDVECHHRDFRLSVVENRNARLAALGKAIAALPEKAPRLERETLAALNGLLNSLARGSTEETDYPAARLLSEVEQVVATAAKGERWYGPAKIGQFWLALPTGEKQTTRVRVLVPQQIKSANNVLVIALHGEGGSENTFFDTYGDGLIVKQCEMRGWLLVAPRLEASGNAPLSAIVDAMAAIYPVDRAHVFGVGHSSGASLGLDNVVASPKLFRALAVLAAGREVKEAESLKEFPIYIGAGDHDPVLSEAVLLNETLRAADSKAVTFKIYPTCEHLMVVADALPDVFAWFSSLAH